MSQPHRPPSSGGDARPRAAASAATQADTGAVIVAAGAGVRLPAGGPKPFLSIGGRTILDRALEALEECPAVDRIVLVVGRDHVARVSAGASGKVTAVVPGGVTRRASVAVGLDALPGVDWLVIHDGARPFATPHLVAEVLDAARRAGAATVGLPVTDTLKHVEGDRILATVDRSVLWAVQTPQAFRADLLREAHARVPLDEPVTDDAELVERLGHEVVVVLGDPANVKITTPQDLDLARQRVQGAEGGASAVGIGYDIHRTAPDRRLVLGGVVIPHPVGLQGHSDADVLSHAVMDALLGAAGDRDIGHHFPPDDPAFRDADSLALLARVVERLREAGWAPANVDAVVIAEAPRLGSYVDAMKARLAAVLGVPPGRLGIKATTSEGLGEVGRGEAISAHAVALLRRCD